MIQNERDGPGLCFTLVKVSPMLYTSESFKHTHTRARARIHYHRPCTNVWSIHTILFTILHVMYIYIQNKICKNRILS